MTEPGAGDPAGRRFVIALGVIALAALAIRIAFIVIVDPTVPRIGDASAYHLLGEQLARGRGYIRPFDFLLLHRTRATAEYPPLFPLLLGGAARVGIHGVESQRIVVAFLGAGTVALVGLLGRRVGSPAVGLVAAALAAAYPMLFQSETILMAEALYVPLVTLVLLLAYAAYDRPGIARFAALGAAIGAATLVRAEGLLLGIVLVLPLCVLLRGLPARDRVLRGGVALGLAVIVIAPWTVRNAIRFHTFVPVSNNVATLVDGANCDATYNGTLLGLWRETFSQYGDRARALPQAQACFEGFDIADPHFEEASVASMHLRAGARYARDHAGSLPRVVAVRVLRTWGLYAPRQQINYETLEGRPHTWQLLGTLMYWAMLPFAIAGVVLLRRRRALLWPLLATVVTVSVVAAFTYGQQRFRVAAEPAILVLAAVTIVAAAEDTRRRWSAA